MSSDFWSPPAQFAALQFLVPFGCGIGQPTNQAA
jgi:hypothetical protein